MDSKRSREHRVQKERSRLAPILFFISLPLPTLPNLRTAQWRRNYVLHVRLLPSTRFSYPPTGSLVNQTTRSLLPALRTFKYAYLAKTTYPDAYLDTSYSGRCFFQGTTSPLSSYLQQLNQPQLVHCSAVLQSLKKGLVLLIPLQLKIHRCTSFFHFEQSFVR